MLFRKSPHMEPFIYISFAWDHCFLIIFTYIVNTFLYQTSMHAFTHYKHFYISYKHISQILCYMNKFNKHFYAF